MKIYDEKTGLVLESLDLEAGYVYPGRRKVGTEERVLERTVANHRLSLSDITLRRCRPYDTF